MISIRPSIHTYGRIHICVSLWRNSPIGDILQPRKSLSELFKNAKSIIEDFYIFHAEGAPFLLGPLYFSCRPLHHFCHI